MLGVMRRRKVPALIGSALAAVVAVSAVLATRAPAAPSLPAISAHDLVAEALHATAENGPISGDVAMHIDLGLPSLPTNEGIPGSGLFALLAEFTGDHSLRVWRSADGVRVADILPAAERGIFATKADVWLWDSTTFTAYHVQAPASEGASAQESPASPPRPDPSSLATRFLDAITPTTKVSVGDPTTVAGEPVYPLILEPDTTATLVGRIEIDVDANTQVPLRVAVTPRGAASPAVESGFTSVSFDPIDRSTFRFTAPSGARVKTIKLPSAGPSEAPFSTGGAAATPPQVETFGHAWTEVVAVRIPSATQAEAKNPALAEIAKLLPYSGPLLSVDVVDRGGHRWLVAGMVPLPALAGIEQRLS